MELGYTIEIYLKVYGEQSCGSQFAEEQSCGSY